MDLALKDCAPGILAGKSFQVLAATGWLTNCSTHEPCLSSFRACRSASYTVRVCHIFQTIFSHRWPKAPNAQAWLLRWHADRDRPKLAGTATLLDFGKVRFLVTAAHMIDHDKTGVIQPYFFDRAKLAELPTGFVHTPIPTSVTREDDRIDISFLRLDDATANALARTFYFLPFMCIDANDRISPSRHYMFSGYPKSRAGLLSPRDHKVKTTAHSFTGHALSPSAIRAMKFDPEVDIALDFKQSQMMGEAGKIVTATRPGWNQRWSSLLRRWRAVEMADW